MAVIEDTLKRHNLCSGTHYKEMYLATDELEGGGQLLLPLWLLLDPASILPRPAWLPGMRIH